MINVSLCQREVHNIKYTQLQIKEVCLMRGGISPWRTNGVIHTEV